MCVCVCLCPIYTKKINSQIHPRLLALFEFKLIRYSKVHEKQNFFSSYWTLKKFFLPKVITKNDLYHQLRSIKVTWNLILSRLINCDAYNFYFKSHTINIFIQADSYLWRSITHKIRLWRKLILVLSRPFRVSSQHLKKNYCQISAKKILSCWYHPDQCAL